MIAKLSLSTRAAEPRWGDPSRARRPAGDRRGERARKESLRASRARNPFENDAAVKAVGADPCKRAGPEEAVDEAHDDRCQ